MDAGIQGHGCGVLSSLISFVEQRAQIDAISRAVQVHKMHQGFQEQGQNAMLRISGSSLNNTQAREALDALYFP